jgi:hypothetical protein
MVVLEQIVFGKFGITEWTAMMPVDCFVDTSPAIDVPAPGDETIINLVEADVAEELFL